MDSFPEIVLCTINAKWIHPSLALRLLKANLGSLEDTCEILEFALRQPLREKVEPILAARPRLLGLSVSIWNHTATVELLKALEQEWAGTREDGHEAPRKPIVILGGPEVSWLPEEAEIFRYADYVIRGEAEESFLSICEEVFSGTGQELKSPVFIGCGDTALDVNKIASPYRLYTDEDLERKLIYVEASRGCPFRCEFCQGGARPVREFPLDPFLADMDTLIKRGGRQFKFLDRTFNLDTDRAKRIMEFFLDRMCAGETNPIKESPLCVHFEMVPSRFPPALRELIRLFPPGGLRLEVGIQTFNPRTASLIHRTGEAGEALEILEFLRTETNAITHVDLIAGLPGEDLASFGAGFDRLWRSVSKSSSGAGRFEIQLGILKRLPGTPIARHDEAFGMKYSAEPPYEVMETAALPAADCEKIKNFARFWELAVNRNHFPELAGRLLPPGAPVFEKFMDLSGRLLKHFGRNWGIDRMDLKLYLEGSDK